MKTTRRVQVNITLLALIAIIVHLVWPSLAIDGITLGLIIVAIVPWLAPLIKSLEFPGGWKIEFQDLEKAEKEADKAGLLAPSNTIEPSSEFSFQLVADDDPNLALAGLRIEIEKRLLKIAESNDIPIRRRSVGLLMRELHEAEILSHQEHAVLSDMIHLLNSAVHGADVDQRAANWAMEIGPRLLQSLDNRVHNVKTE